MAKERSFLTLDALRGLAALAVLCYHGSLFFSGDVFPHGYMAVEFFCMLSGFVLTFAYQEKLDGGWSFLAFFKARVIRLYPLYILSTVMGCLFLLIRGHIGKTHVPASTLSELLLCAALFLPAFPGIPINDRSAFPLNEPSWSLFGELIANIVHALFLRRRSDGFLIAVAILAALSAVFPAWRNGKMDYGWSRVDILWGISRVMYSYVVGILIYRWWSKSRLQIHIPPAVPCLVLLAGLAIPGSASTRLPVDILLVLVVWPVLLLFGASSPAPVRLAPLFRMLGVSSYAVYVLHWPVSDYFQAFWFRTTGRLPIVNAPWTGLLYMICTLLLALLLDKIYDVPVRRCLTSRFHARRSAL